MSTSASLTKQKSVSYGSTQRSEDNKKNKEKEEAPADSGSHPFKSCNLLVAFPLMLAGNIVFLQVSCFLQGYLKGHFHIFLPLVSDTGNYNPEASTFTISIILIGILFLVVATIRYLQCRAIIRDPTGQQLLAHYYSTFCEEAVKKPAEDTVPETPEFQLRSYSEKKEWLEWSNVWMLRFGVLISFSCIATGAYRFAESFVWHNASAIGVFILTPVYMTLNTWMSGIWMGAVNSVAIYQFRKWVTTFNVICCTFFCVTMAILSQKYKPVYENPPTRLFWNTATHGGGYWLHAINSLSEWLFLWSIAPFSLSLAADFSRLRLAGLRLTYTFEPIETDLPEKEKQASADSSDPLLSPSERASSRADVSLNDSTASKKSANSSTGSPNPAI